MLQKGVSKVANRDKITYSILAKKVMWVMWVKILGMMERIAQGLPGKGVLVSAIFIESSGTHKLN